jgi:hypothetical protein
MGDARRGAPLIHKGMTCGREIAGCALRNHCQGRHRLSLTAREIGHFGWRAFFRHDCSLTGPTALPVDAAAATDFRNSRRRVCDMMTGF